MKKRALSLVMMALLVSTSMISCGDSKNSAANNVSGQPGTVSGSEGSAASSGETLDPAAQAVADRSETVDLVVNWFAFNGSPKDLDMVNEATNELTVKDLNISVSMEVTDYASRSQQLTLQIAGGEQLDIFWVGGLTYPMAVANPYTAVTNVYNEYKYGLEYGVSAPDTAIPEMNEKMMAAGLQDIIDEKQRQLDDWLAANKS